MPKRRSSAAAKAAAAAAHAAAVKAAAARRLQEAAIEEATEPAAGDDAAGTSSLSPRIVPTPRQTSAGATPRPGPWRTQNGEGDEFEDDEPEEGAEVPFSATDRADLLQPASASDMIWKARRLIKAWEPRFRRVEEREAELAEREAQLAERESRLTAGECDPSSQAEVLAAMGFEKCARARIADIVSLLVSKERKAVLQRAARDENRCWVNDLLARQRALFDLWQAYTELQISDPVESERIAGYALDAMDALSHLCKGMQSKYFEGKVEGLKQIASQPQNVQVEPEVASKPRRGRRKKGGSS
eukprot:TRINITY_DN45062_c0_g1_i1.p1 TRINITY_DN45062_c0_g1~~TRINITY_DN45062_c0_g1_i1.p1  ORF type:complete len:332 (-),score=57.85 TRINITY_DN45062_c0_g1_i1:244-1149(-)